MNRSELREIVMKVLYQIDIFNEAKTDYDIKTLVKEQLEVENEFVNSLIDGIIKEKRNIRKLANDHLKDWTIDRLSKPNSKKYQYLHKISTKLLNYLKNIVMRK